MENNTCVFFANEENITSDIDFKIKNIIKELVTLENVTNFIFTTKGAFSNLCYIYVTLLKLEYPFIKRILYCEKEISKKICYENFDEVIVYKKDEKEGNYPCYYNILSSSNVSLFYVKEKQNCDVFKAFEFANQTTQLSLNLLK